MAQWLRTMGVCRRCRCKDGWEGENEGSFDWAGKSGAFLYKSLSRGTTGSCKVSFFLMHSSTDNTSAGSSSLSPSLSLALYHYNRFHLCSKHARYSYTYTIVSVSQMSRTLRIALPTLTIERFLSTSSDEMMCDDGRRVR